MNKYLSDTTIEKLNTQYDYTEPYSFSTIDNFFNEEIAIKLKEEAKSIPFQNAVVKVEESEEEKFKVIFSYSLPETTNEVLDFLNNDEFISHFEKFSSINNIIKQENKQGSSYLVKIYPGGFTKSHIDMNMVPRKHPIQKRVNMFIFLNDEWKEQFNGNVLISDPKTEELKYKIEPKFNRCVILNNSKKSVYGHQINLSNLPNIFLSVSYYTQPNCKEVIENSINQKFIVDYEGEIYRPNTLVDVTKFNYEKIKRI